MAFDIQSNSLGKETMTTVKKREILIDGAADLVDIPADTVPGSVPYTADLTEMYMKKIDGTWTRIGGAP